MIFFFFNLSLELDSIRYLKCELNITLYFCVVVIIFPFIVPLAAVFSLKGPKLELKSHRVQHCWFPSLSDTQMLFPGSFILLMVEIGFHKVA